MFVVLTPRTELAPLAGYFVMLWGLILAARVPVGHVLRRSAAVIPIIIMVGLMIPFSQSLAGPRGTVFFNMAVKAWLSVTAGVVLSATTPFDQMIMGLRRLRIPLVLVVTISFMYRYLFVLLAEGRKMERAWSARYFGGFWRRQFQVMGNLIAVLFCRTQARGDRIYQAMLARGFTGEVRVMERQQLTWRDLFFSGGFILGLALIRWGVNSL